MCSIKGRYNMNKIAKVIVLFVCLLLLTGCKGSSRVEQSQNLLTQEEICWTELREIATIYEDIYKRGLTEGTLQTLEVKQKIIECLGEAGYSVSDTENEINMENSEPVRAFCETAKRGEDAEVTLYLIMDDGGIVKYDLTAEKSNIKVVRSSLLWDGLKMRNGCYEEFDAYTWDFTEKGYLFLEEYHPEGYDGNPGKIGIRVTALDQSLRELNQKYVAPIGYGGNNLLITEWNEEDYTALDFYDLYELLYRQKYGCNAPGSDTLVGKELTLPAQDFENIVQEYLDIENTVLREVLPYNADNQTYRYRPRTIYDMEMPYGPYPEVVSCETLEGGLLKLTIEAVWVIEKVDCALTSELTIRPLENGGFQYVSNHVVSKEGNMEPTWYCPRLTDEEWEELFGEIRE